VASHRTILPTLPIAAFGELASFLKAFIIYRFSHSVLCKDAVGQDRIVTKQETKSRKKQDFRNEQVGPYLEVTPAVRRSFFVPVGEVFDQLDLIIGKGG